MKPIDKIINSIVNDGQDYSIEDIEQVLNYIADEKRQELGNIFVVETTYDNGAQVKHERTEQGLLQIEIGYEEIYNILEQKELHKYGLLDESMIIHNDTHNDERKAFIELILSLFHELQHVKQIDSITNPTIPNDETIRMTQETVINEFFPGFISQYNYEQSILEIDAMRASLKDTVDFFSRMKVHISSNEVFNVMKEKELSYLKYDLQAFGNTYDTAISYFEQIKGKMNDINGIDKSIELLEDQERKKLFKQCEDLIQAYGEETNVEKKLDLLEQMALRMKPELAKQYPLIYEKIDTYHR